MKKKRKTYSFIYNAAWDEYFDVHYPGLFPKRPVRGKRTGSYFSYRARWNLFPIGREWHVYANCPDCNIPVDLTNRSFRRSGMLDWEKMNEMACTEFSCGTSNLIFLKHWGKYGLNSKGKPRDPMYWVRAYRNIPDVGGLVQAALSHSRRFSTRPSRSRLTVTPMPRHLATALSCVDDS